MMQSARGVPWKNLAPLALVLGTLVCLGPVPPSQGDEPPTSSSQLLVGERFDQLRNLIRPQPGESRWMEIPWEIDLHEARHKAAAQGKPLFVLSGGGATAIGPC
jgi:hypothetical protein